MKYYLGVFCLLSNLFTVPASATCGYRYYSNMEKAKEAAQKLEDDMTKYCYTFTRGDLADCMRGMAQVTIRTVSSDHPHPCQNGEDQFIVIVGGVTLDQGDRSSSIRY
ncbi:MAG: hypothetical protein SGJ18_08690 [Pseudomonadota bacterium]|nr:hypothetical protein [Pseudomonadota bacterium]